MTIEMIKDEVEYYTGRTCSDDEAKEIKWFCETNHASLEEVISAYYGC